MYLIRNLFMRWCFLALSVTLTYFTAYLTSFTLCCATLQSLTVYDFTLSYPTLCNLPHPTLLCLIAPLHSSPDMTLPHLYLASPPTLSHLPSLVSVSTKQSLWRAACICCCCCCCCQQMEQFLLYGFQEGIERGVLSDPPTFNPPLILLQSFSDPTLILRLPQDMQ